MLGTKANTRRAGTGHSQKILSGAPDAPIDSENDTRGLGAVGITLIFSWQRLWASGEFQVWRARMSPPCEQLRCHRLVGVKRSRDKVIERTGKVEKQ